MTLPDIILSKIDDSKEEILYNSIYVKFKNRKNKLMMISYTNDYICMLTGGMREPPEMLEIFCIQIYKVVTQAFTFIKHLICIFKDCTQKNYYQQRLVVLLCCCCSVASTCPTFCDPVDCSPPGSSVHGVLQARILWWVALPRGSSQPRDQTPIFYVSCFAGRFFTTEPPGKPVVSLYYILKYNSPSFSISVSLEYTKIISCVVKSVWKELSRA